MQRVALITLASVAVTLAAATVSKPEGVLCTEGMCAILYTKTMGRVLHGAGCVQAGARGLYLH